MMPVIYRPDAVRPFGHSRISRANMSIVNSALRTIKRSEISAEFYSFPQKYVVGLDPDADPLEKWKATMSSMLSFTKDEDGDSPTLGQFTQQSMSPYTEQLRTFASLFAGENGLTLDDLGFVSDNPSSAEAIKASHENLRLTARKAQRVFGSCLLNVGFLAACVRDDFPYRRRQLYLTKPVWEPIFEPDAAMLSTIGDGAVKINQAVPNYFNKDNLRDLTGIESSELDPIISEEE
nr:MAG TPA: PORTAL PROTEIN [Caudoviricetes sp.]